MKRIFLIFLLLLLTSEIRAAEWFTPLTINDVGLEGMFFVMVNINYQQYISARKQGLDSITPIGKNPDRRQVQKAMAGALLFHSLTYYALPKHYRTLFASYSIAFGTCLIHRNQSITIQHSF